MQRTNPWVRLYRTALHNPKLVSLNDRQHRAWCSCLLMADDTGLLPKMRDVACHLRTTTQDAESVVCDLVEAGLVDVEGPAPARRFRLHDWRTHQYVSDNSTQRVHKFRQRRRAETAVKRFSSGDVTPPESDSESDSDSPTHAQTETPAPPPDGFSSCVLNRRASRGVSPQLRRRAEGLGLPVDDLVAMATAPHVNVPNAMFRTLAVKRLQQQLTHANKQTLATALTKNGDAAFGTVCGMILESPRFDADVLGSDVEEMAASESRRREPAPGCTRIAASDPRFAAAVALVAGNSPPYAEACRRSGFVDVRHDRLQKLEVR